MLPTLHSLPDIIVIQSVNELTYLIEYNWKHLS